MQAVRRILETNPNATGGQIAELMRSQFNLDMDSKVASSYKYTILKSQGKTTGRRGRPAAGAGSLVAAQPAARAVAGDDREAINDLMRAAEKLGLSRVKELVDGFLRAPK
jgi:hypothetical protein